MLLLLFLLNPFIFLSVRSSFEAEATNVQQDAEDIGYGDDAAESGEGRGWQGIDSHDGEEAQRDPGCLGEESYCKLGGRVSNVLESRVFAI